MKDKKWIKILNNIIDEYKNKKNKTKKDYEFIKLINAAKADLN
jgi:hypothetical protein